MGGIRQSVWHLAVVAGAKRLPTVVGFVLTLAAVEQALVSGSASVAWWGAGALAAFLVAVAWAYHDLRTENERLVAVHLTADDRWERLETQFRKAQVVRSWLMFRGDLNRSLPEDEDQLLEWASETYDLLLEKFPAEADDFMDEDASMGAGFFAASYVFRGNRWERLDYLERQIELVRRILRTRVSG